MFLVHSHVDLQVTEQLWVQPEGLITQEVLQAARNITWERARVNQTQTNTPFANINLSSTTEMYLMVIITITMCW